MTGSRRVRVCVLAVLAGAAPALAQTFHGGLRGAVHDAGGRGVLLRTGYGRDEERRIESEPAELRPDYVADDLAAAVAWVVASDEARGAT